MKVGLLAREVEVAAASLRPPHTVPRLHRRLSCYGPSATGISKQLLPAVRLFAGTIAFPRALPKESKHLNTSDGSAGESFGPWSA
jgi:hypothetical protein